MISDMSMPLGSHPRAPSAAKPHARVVFAPEVQAEAPEPRRSLGGWITPLLCVILGASSLGWLLIDPDMDWGIGVDPDWILLLVAACATLAAVWIERQIQRQLHLARRGDEAVATIDAFQRPNDCRDEIVVTYHFLTADGARVAGRSVISNDEWKRLTQPGSKVIVLYDPQQPNVNALMGSLWGVLAV